MTLRKATGRRLVLISVIIIAAFILTACVVNGIEGEWVEPVPGMANQMQGVNLEKGGKASSINMATLQYEKWEQRDDILLLSGKSIGNGMTISFIDTFTIEKLSADELMLKKGDFVVNYKKR